MYSFGADGSLAGSGSGWKYSDINRILEENPGSFFTTFSPKEYFDRFISVYLAENIDYKEKKCSFDTDEFRELLKLFSAPGSNDEYNSRLEYYYENGYDYYEDDYTPAEVQLKNNTVIACDYDSFYGGIGELSYYTDGNGVNLQI